MEQSAEPVAAAPTPVIKTEIPSVVPVETPGRFY